MVEDLLVVLDLQEEDLLVARDSDVVGDVVGEAASGQVVHGAGDVDGAGEVVHGAGAIGAGEDQLLDLLLA